MHLEKDELRKIHEKLMNMTLRVAAGIGVITIVFQTIRDFNIGFSSTYYFQVSVFALIFISALFVKKIPLNLKFAVVVLLPVLVLVSGLHAYGFIASSKIYIVAVTIFASFLLKFRTTLLWLLFLMIIYFAFGLMYSRGILDYNFDTQEYIQDFNRWVLDGTILLFVSVGLLFLGKYYNEKILESSTRIAEKEKESEDNDKKYRALFDNSNDAILLIENGIYFDCNKKAEEMFAGKRDEILGKSPVVHSPKEQPDGRTSKEKAASIFKRIQEGESLVFEWKHRRLDGSLFDVSISINPVQLGEKQYVQAVLRDITMRKKNEEELDIYRNALEALVKERTSELQDANEELQYALQDLKETQQKLIQSEKMASLGVLTSGVAHEINNPLNFIQGGYFGLNHLLQGETLENGERIQKLLDGIKTGVDRTSAIVKSLNKFSRSNDSVDEDCVLKSIIEDTLVILHNQTKDRIEITKNCKEEKVVVKGNEGRLHQAFLNILQNAVQAIEGEGKIEIGSKSDDTHISVEISDNGSGIPEELLPQISDPFFTTKDPGKGTGLGLSITYSIIEDHEGTIEFESEVGKGTTVKISLPINK
jgi:PAS domain S-box-containing protein